MNRFNPSGRTILWLAVWIMILASAAPLAAQDAEVSASVSTDTIGTQDQLQLTVTVAGSGAGDARTPRLPRLDGLKVVAGPSVSTRYQWINGQSSNSKSFIYVLMADREGQFTIGPVEVQVGNKTFKTEPIQVRVTAASQAPPPSAQPQRANPPNPLDPFDPFSDDFPTRRQQASADQVFVAAHLDKNTAYVGQQVTLTYHLFTQVHVTGLQLQESPPLNGFWVEDLQVAKNPTGTRRIINGKEYLDYVIKKQALFANAAGKITIPPSTFAVSVKAGGDFFGIFGQADTVYRKNGSVILDVKQLPAEGRPAGFRNAVGSFHLSGSLDKKEVAAGDAVSFKVTLSGKGNLKTIPDLQLPAIPDFTVYSSKKTDKIRPSGDQIGGDKVWEYVLVPKAPGDHTIPALSFSYFDPDRKTYETLSTPALPLKVTGGNTEGTITDLSGINKQNLTRQGTDINFIKLEADDLRVRRTPFYHSLWFYLLAGIGLLFNTGAVVYERRRSGRDDTLMRVRRARRLAFERLKKAEKAAKAEPRRFYDLAALALSGYLEDRFGIPEIEVTADSLERNLAGKSVPPETIRETKACMEECDFGRIISASSAPDKIRALSGRIRTVVDTLERTVR